MRRRKITSHVKTLVPAASAHRMVVNRSVDLHIGASQSAIFSTSSVPTSHFRFKPGLLFGISSHVKRLRNLVPAALAHRLVFNRPVRLHIRPIQSAIFGTSAACYGHFRPKPGLPFHHCSHVKALVPAASAHQLVVNRPLHFHIGPYQSAISRTCSDSARNFSSKSDPTDDANRICSILSKEDWNLDIQEQLCNLKIKNFTSSLVKLVLRSLKEHPKNCLYFYWWMETREGFLHDDHSFNAMAEVLGIDELRDVFMLFIEVGCKAGYELDMATFVAVSAMFREAEKAVQFFEFYTCLRLKPTENMLYSLLQTIIDAKELDIQLFRRAVKAYQRNGESMSPHLEQTVVDYLRSVGKCRYIKEVELVMGEPYSLVDRLFKPLKRFPMDQKLYAEVKVAYTKAIMKSVILRLKHKPKPPVVRNTDPENNIGLRLLNKYKPNTDYEGRQNKIMKRANYEDAYQFVKDKPLPPVVKIIDAKSFGIKGCMISIASWIVLRTLRRQGFDAFLVGGCVRDLVINRTPRDFDVVTTCSLEKTHSFFKKSLILGARHQICIIDVGKSNVEVSETGTGFMFFERPCGWEKRDCILYNNSQERDFTINSLFLDAFCLRIYDYNTGVEDLESRRLRTIIAARQSFRIDCARILRGVRIAARLGLSLSNDIEEAIPNFVDSVARLQGLRLMREMNFMFSYGAAVSSISLLKRLKLLDVLLPFQAADLEGESKLQRLFASMDEMFSIDSPASENTWVSLLAFHTTLVLSPQPRVVVSALGSLLSCGQWDVAIMRARELTPSHLDDKSLAEAVLELASLVRKTSFLLVNKETLLQVLGPVACSDKLQVFIERERWERAISVFKVARAEDILGETTDDTPTAWSKKKKVIRFVIDSDEDDIDIIDSPPFELKRMVIGHRTSEVGDVILKCIQRMDV